MSNVPIQGIEFEIKGEADSAATSIGNFATALERLQGIVNRGLGLKALSDNLSKFKQDVAGLGKVKIGKSFTDSITQLGTSLEKVDSDKLLAISEAMNTLQFANKANISVKGIDSLSRALDSFSGNTEALAEAYHNLQAISALDFSNLREAAQNIRTVSRQSNIHEEENNPQSSGITDVLDQSDIAYAESLWKRLSETMNSLFPKIESLKQAFAKLGASLSQGFVGIFNGIIHALKSVGNATLSAAKHLHAFNQTLRGNVVSGVREASTNVQKFMRNLASTQWNRATSNAKKFSDKISTLASSFKRILFYRMIRTVIKEIGEALKEGTENAYFYSKNIGEATKYISEAYDSFASASFQMKNQIGAAWATIFAMIQPILNQIIALVQRAAEVVTQFFAIMSGKTTYLKALNYAKEWAEEAENGSKAAKEWKNQLLGFDEINRLEEPSSGSGKSGKTPEDYAAMFEEVPVNEISDKFSSIFQVFKDAWASQGQPTINAIKGAIDSLKATFASVGDSFLQVFTNGAGQAVLEAYLRITQNVANAFKNLADRFREAWTANGVGTALVQASFGIWQTWLGFIERITGAFSNWASKLDFKPLLTSILGLRISFMELANTVLTWLGNAYENVLLPFGKWTIEEALPESIETLASAMDFLRAVGEKLEPIFSKLWNDILKPLAEWGGDTFISVMDSLQSTFDSLTQKIESANSLGDFIQSLEGKEKIIVALVGAIAGLAIIATISTLFSGLATVIGLLLSPVSIAVGAFSLLVYAGIQLYQKFDSVREAVDTVAEKFSEFKDRCGDPQYWAELGTSIVAAIGTALGALAGSAWKWLTGLFKKPEDNTDLEDIGEDTADSVLQGIKNKFNKVKDWVVEHVLNPFTKGWKEAFEIGSPSKKMEPIGKYIAEGVLEGIKSIISGIGEWVKTNVFDPFIDAVKTVFGINGDSASETESIGSSLMSGMLSGITKGWDEIKQWWENNIAKYFTWDYWHGKFSELFNSFTFPKIVINWEPVVVAGKRLFDFPTGFDIQWAAKGGIVDGATLIGAGEAGKEAIIPLERNTEWIGKVAAEMNRQVIQEDDGDLAADLEDANGVVVNAIMAATSQIIRAMQENDGSGYDFDNFVRIVTQVQRKQARASGAY